MVMNHWVGGSLRRERAGCQQTALWKDSGVPLENSGVGELVGPLHLSLVPLHLLFCLMRFPLGVPPGSRKQERRKKRNLIVPLFR